MILCPSGEPEIQVALCSTMEEVREAERRNLPVIGLETGEERLPCKFIALSREAVDDAFLRKVHARHFGLPLTILETERFRLRELCLQDMDALFSLYSDPVMTAYNEPLYEYEEEREYQRKYIEMIYGFYGFGMWLVIDKATGEVVGRIGVENRTGLPPDTVELGYSVGVPWQGKGIATEVCTAVLKYTKEQIGMRYAVAKVNPSNTPSWRLAKRLGFREETSGPNERGEIVLRREL